MYFGGPERRIYRVRVKQSKERPVSGYDQDASAGCGCAAKPRRQEA
jgi:hypothetical protein